jgi:hypothetical protein
VRVLARLLAVLAPALALGSSVPVEPEAAFPGARLGRADGATEYWDVTAVFEQGHRIFARFSISNEGPGENTGYALGQILFPDGRIVPFQNGRLEGDWSLSDDRLRVKVGSSVLDLHGPPYHFEVDKSKKGVKFFLDYESTGPPRSWKGAPRGYHLDLLTLGGAVRGTLWVRGVVDDPVPVSGRITVTHAWMDEGEPGLLRRRIEPHGVTSADGGTNVYAVHALEVRSSGESTWLVARSGETWREADGFGVSLEGRSDGSEEGYPIPRALVLAGRDVRGRIEIGRRLLSHDPLEVAPRPFRWLLSSRTEPSHVWLESRHSLEWLGAAPTSFEGSGVSSFYFINPVD